MTAKRQPFATRKIRLVGEMQREAAIVLLRNLPLDAQHPIEAVFREEVKARKLDQNALMWAGPLKDIAEQAYVNGRAYSADIWHEHMKELYLPDDYDAELCKSEDYRKWDYSPSGRRVLVGSTGDLTVKGMSLYIEQVHAFGAGLGVIFHANPADARRAA